MKLRIKPKFNPPKIGKSTEEGLIATKEFSLDKDINEKSYIVISGINDLKREFMEEFCEVITEEIK